MTNATISNKGSKGGRPQSGTREQRLEQLLEDATRVFLEFGYGSTNMDILAREAHVAKRTIYQYFGGKDELFGAVVRHLSDTILVPFYNLSEDKRPIEQALTCFAHQLLAQVLSPKAIGLYRIVISEASRFPELALQFYDNGPAREITALTDYLGRQKELGTIKLEDPAIAAEQFFNMVLSELHRRALLGIDKEPKPGQIERHVDTAVRLFLQACSS